MKAKPLPSPSCFIATGRLLCEELTAGTSPEDLINRYIGALAEVGIDTAADDLVPAGSYWV